MSYTKLGYWARSRRWDSAALRTMNQQVVLVTGATSGIGAAASEGFARLGATVWLGSRDRERGERTRARIAEATGNDDVRVAVLDLAELRSVHRFVQEFVAVSPRLDVLVHNAGVLTPERSLSRDGVELTLATNVVGPFLLNQLTRPLLGSSAPARIVNVSSGGMYTQRLHVDDLQSARGEFSGVTAYARTKRAQVVLSEMWAERLSGTGVVVNAMHPGWVDTPGLSDALPGFRRLVGPVLRTPEQGADTIVWLGAAPEPGQVSGAFWFDRARRSTHLLPWTRETGGEREQLWSEVERLSTGNR